MIVKIIIFMLIILEGQMNIMDKTEENICNTKNALCIEGENHIGFGLSAKEEMEEDKKRDSREGVVEYTDKDGITWKYINIYFEGIQPITIWENQKTKKKVEMLGYYAPNGRLRVNSENGGKE